MKLKIPFKEHILSKLWLYISAVLLCPVICIAVLTIKNNPPKEQRINIFVQGVLTNDSTFYKDIKNVVSEDKIVNLYCYSSSNEQFNNAFSNYALSTDLFIISKTFIETKGMGLFAEIPISNELYSDTNFMIDNHHFGVYVPNSSKEWLSTSLSFDNDEYYCFVNYDSVHTKSFKDDGKTDQCFRLIKYLVNYEKEK